MLDLLNQFIQALAQTGINIVELGLIFGVGYGVIKGISWIFSTGVEIVEKHISKK